MMNGNLSERQKTISHLRNMARNPVRLALAEPIAITYDTIGLDQHLECRLTPTALDLTYGDRNRSEQKVLVAKALLVVGSTLMLCAIVFYCIGTLLHLDEPIDLRVTWGIRSLIVLGLMSLPIICGLVLLRTEKSRPMTDLEDLEHSGFETEEMNTEFEEFKSRGHECKPTIGFALTENRLLTLTEDVWQSSDLALIIFGTEVQRRWVLNSGQFALSSLVIKKSDWKKFASVWEAKKKAQTLPKPPLSTEVKSLRTQAEKNDTKKYSASDKEPLTAPTKPLSLRQKARGENTNWCPRIEMMYSDRLYLDRYKEQKLDVNSFKVERQPCHRILVLSHANFEDFKLFFERGELTEAEKDCLSKLNSKVKHALNVVGQNQISRYNQLKIKKWIVLEKHIEEAGVISDQELVRANPHLQQFQDSRQMG